LAAHAEDDMSKNIRKSSGVIVFIVYLKR